jgi:periplasmic mercuric ion binding protein
MKRIQIMLTALFLGLFFVNTAAAQAAASGVVKKKATVAAVAEKIETFQVLGNCGMCKKTIEKAALAAGAKTAAWNLDADLLTVVFDPAKTTLDALQKAVAQSGYDNAGYKAPDAAYNGLHGCCQYDRSGAPGTAKSCEAEKGN